MLLAGRVPDNDLLLAGRVSDNNLQLAGGVLDNNLPLAGSVPDNNFIHILIQFFTNNLKLISDQLITFDCHTFFSLVDSADQFMIWL